MSTTLTCLILTAIACAPLAWERDLKRSILALEDTLATPSTPMDEPEVIPNRCSQIGVE